MGRKLRMRGVSVVTHSVPSSCPYACSNVLPSDDMSVPMVLSATGSTVKEMPSTDSMPVPHLHSSDQQLVNVPLPIGAGGPHTRENDNCSHDPDASAAWPQARDLRQGHDARNNEGCLYEVLRARAGERKQVEARATVVCMCACACPEELLLGGCACADPFLSASTLHDRRNSRTHALELLGVGHGGRHDEQRRHDDSAHHGLRRARGAAAAVLLNSAKAPGRFSAPAHHVRKVKQARAVGSTGISATCEAT